MFYYKDKSLYDNNINQISELENFQSKLNNQFKSKAGEQLHLYSSLAKLYNGTDVLTLQDSIRGNLVMVREKINKGIFKPYY